MVAVSLKKNFFQAEDGIRDLVRSRGLGDVYKRQDVASDVIETPEQVADTIGRALQFVPKQRLFPCTNCGLAPMSRAVALQKLQALADGAALARKRYDLPGAQA